MLIVFCLTGSGCIYLASLQEPKVLEEGVFRGGLGLSYVDTHSPITEDSFLAGFVRDRDWDFFVSVFVR